MTDLIRPLLRALEQSLSAQAVADAYGEDLRERVHRALVRISEFPGGKDKNAIVSEQALEDVRKILDGETP